MHTNSKVFFTSFIGTMLEYYDFALYAVFLPKIVDHFFLASSKDSLGLLTFSLSFLARPFGAIIFGFIGDRFGRKKAFGLPLIFMAISTLLITVIPSYAEIGILSSIFIISCRLGQGFCLGAEYGGALVFALEHNNKSLGVVAGLLGSAVISGSLLATIISFIFTLPMFPDSFWRVPFVIGSLVGAVGIWSRLCLAESPEFKLNQSPKVPILVILKQYPLSFIKIASASGLNGLMGSLIFVYFNYHFVKVLGWNLNQSLILVIYAHIIALLTSPIAGLLSQKYTATRIIKLVGCSIIVIILPCIYFINGENIFLVILSISLLSILTGMCWGSANLLSYSAFPVSIRYTGIAFSDSIGRLLFSAPIPFLCNYFVNSFGNIASGFVPIVFIIVILMAQHIIDKRISIST